jgi:hypothetical protein
MRGRKRISMAGVCCYRPDGSDARLAFHLREGAYDTDQLIPIVAALGRLLGGDAPVIVVWDNLPAHTSLAMRAWAAERHRPGHVPGGGVGPQGAGAVVLHRDRVARPGRARGRVAAKGSRVVVVGKLQQRSWTTGNGAAQSTVEVVAKELGPSLRWATATTTRATRSSER